VKSKGTSAAAMIYLIYVLL